MSQHQKPLYEAANGKWVGILKSLGMDGDHFSGKHGPCPICGGKDRWRWVNEDGRGTAFCSQCLPRGGDGVDIAAAFTQTAIPDLYRRIRGIIDGPEEPKQDAPGKPKITDEEAYGLRRGLIGISKTLVDGDPVDTYLAGRGLGEKMYPTALRFVPNAKDGEGGVRPCMIAAVHGVRSGRAADGLHRTFLTRDGRKAEIASPRKLMPGSLPEGACIRLGEHVSGGTLGIAEGIETAMGASNLYDMPVWAAINSNLLSKWIPPEDVGEVVIFGDNDPKYGGQHAAYALAHRLAVKGQRTSVMIPKTSSEDWADIWLREVKQH